MSHSPIYYLVRKVVRVLVRLVALLLTLVAIAWLFTRGVDNRPSCPIRIVSPNEWEWVGAPIEIAKCSPPDNMILNPDYSWDWVRE